MTMRNLYAVFVVLMVSMCLGCTLDRAVNVLDQAPAYLSEQVVQLQDLLAGGG